MQDHREGVNGFGWAFDGSAVVSACEDRCVRLFTFSESIDKGTFCPYSSRSSVSILVSFKGVLTRQINIHGIPVDVGFLNDTDNIVVLCKGRPSINRIRQGNEPFATGFLDTASLLFYTNQPLEVGGAHWTCSRTVCA